MVIKCLVLAMSAGSSSESCMADQRLASSKMGCDILWPYYYYGGERLTSEGSVASLQSFYCLAISVEAPVHMCNTSLSVVSGEAIACFLYLCGVW